MSNFLQLKSTLAATWEVLWPFKTKNCYICPEYAGCVVKKRRVLVEKVISAVKAFPITIQPPKAGYLYLFAS